MLTADTLPGLLATICQRPDDLDARLVMADALEEDGQGERAEFVRVQIELDKRGCNEIWCEKIHRENYPIGKRCEQADECDGVLRRRESELWQAANNGHDWFDLAAGFTATLGDPTGSNVPALRVRRGFAEEVYCRCGLWHEYGPQIILASPVVKVTLSDKEPFHRGGGYCWLTIVKQRWELLPGQESEHSIPYAIHRLLTGGQLIEFRDGDPWIDSRSYPDEQAALDAISTAAILQARTAAKLG